MGLREQVTEQVKASMKAGDGARTATLRMVMARIKDADIAARPKIMGGVSDEEIVAALRAMVKTRRESITLYQQGNRPELAAKEAAEIEVIDGFLPRAPEEGALRQAVEQAIADTKAASVKDIGKVMAALKARLGTGGDMARLNAMAREKLGQ